MVAGKKPSDMSNGAPKYKDQPQTMSYQRKEPSGGLAGKNDSRSQNGNANTFRTDSVISGSKNQNERVLQRWVPDAPEDGDGSLEGGRTKPSSGAGWDQFAENERRFGLTTDYDENIYTTAIDRSHPQYKQRVAEADKKAREIERSVATNSHIAEERITDNLGGGENGVDEEDKYSGVRRQDFPPLTSSSNKYTPPARRPPTGQSTVSGVPVDPAIISSQLARPDKQPTEKAAPSPASKTTKPETTVLPASTESKSTPLPDPKPNSSHPPASTTRTASPNVRPEGVPNATATVERDVASAFKGFAAQQRRNVEQVRSAKAKNDKEVKLNDLKRFADSFKLHTPVPTDLVSIIAKDPAKQKEIQEKAKRNAEEAKAHPPEASKSVTASPDTKLPQRPVAATHGTSPSNPPSRQNANRASGSQSQYSSQSFRTSQSSQSQLQPSSQQNRQTGNLTSRLRHHEQNKSGQMAINSIPIHEHRLPPTGPSNPADANFSRRSSGVASAQGARLNPNSSEFRPSPHAATFNPNGNPSTGSSPRSATTLTEKTPSPPVQRSLLRRAPLAEKDRPSIKGKFDALEHIKSLKPAPEKNWKSNGGFKPAYDTPPIWRQATLEDKPESTIHLTYAKLFDMTPFPPQTMSPSHPSHAVPQVPHQHQLPFHLQQGVHLGARGSPRQPPSNLHGNQHGHGPHQSFNGGDDHRMMPSHSAQSYAASPRLQNVSMFPSPMGQPAQLAYNPQMMPYGAPPMQQFRSLSQSHQFVPQQPHMGPTIMMQNPANGFMTSQGMAPGPQIMFPQNQGHFMPPTNGHPPAMPINGYPSPGRSAAPMMMSQGSQQGHQQQPIYGLNPGMSPGPQYGNVAPMFAQQPPGQMPRGYGGPNQFGTSPQQMHQFPPQQHRNNHQNGNYNNNKNFPQHGQHPNAQPNPVPTGPQARPSEASEEAK